jgi:diaminohydroxyphosphoribosylaminopyrimidine deaminase/5-amino-6-(5-phosphoribosylamino)uracil reductase
MLISGFLQPLPDVTPVIPSVDETFAIDPTVTPHESSIIFFYKTWDPYGAFSNFSPHPIEMPDENGDYATWLSVEHYYQVLPFLHNLFLCNATIVEFFSKTSSIRRHTSLLG